MESRWWEVRGVTGYLPDKLGWAPSGGQVVGGEGGRGVRGQGGGSRAAGLGGFTAGGA